MQNNVVEQETQYFASELQELAPGVWAYIQPDGSWMVNNMGFIESSRGNISIDVTSTEKRTAAYLAAMESATGRGVRYLVYTHAHPDHCNGASLLKDAVVVAHEKARTELRAGKSVEKHIFSPFDQGSVRFREPEVTYTRSMSLYADEQEVRVIHPGMRAHTEGDSYVWLPESRILFAGDLVFNGGTPFLLSGSATGWLEALAQLRSLNPAVIVPGHGPVGGPDLLDTVGDYLRFVWDAAADGKAKGLSPLEASRALDLGRFAELLDAERIVGNLHSAYAQIAGESVDNQAAFQDMFEYNGGRPLRCTA